MRTDFWDGQMTPQTPIQASTEPNGMNLYQGEPKPFDGRYAGFWRRFGAYLIDGILLLVSFQIVGFFLGFIDGIYLKAENHFIDPQAVEAQLMPWLVVIDSLVVWLYYTILESSPIRATVGKLAVGLYVSDELGNRVSFGRANARYWSKILSSLIFDFGYFMIGWTRRKQGLHDEIANTLVLRKPSRM